MKRYQSIEKHDRAVSMANDENESMIIVSQIQKKTGSERCGGPSFSALTLLYLHPKKSIEDINNNRLIEKHDRSVSVPNDGNEHMIIVSKTTGFGRRCERCFFGGQCFSA